MRNATVGQGALLRREDGSARRSPTSPRPPAQQLRSSAPPAPGAPPGQHTQLCSAPNPTQRLGAGAARSRGSRGARGPARDCHGRCLGTRHQSQHSLVPVLQRAVPRAAAGVSTAARTKPTAPRALPGLRSPARPQKPGAPLPDQTRGWHSHEDSERREHRSPRRYKERTHPSWKQRIPTYVPAG